MWMWPILWIILSMGHKMNTQRPEYVRIPSAITLVSGETARTHLNRLLTSNISNDRLFSRRHSVICDLNGRISSYQLHADLGDQILLVHDDSVSENLRNNLTTGISWNETVNVSIGDGAIHRVLVYGKGAENVIIKLGVNVNHLNSANWVEYNDSMISVIDADDGTPIYELLVPTRELSSVTMNLEDIGVVEGKKDTAMALQSYKGIIDSSINLSGNNPLHLGLTEIVDLKKGCYPGQEIHARMESRDAIKKTLSSFRSNSQLSIGRHKTSNGLGVQVISSDQFTQEWINLIVHSSDLNVYPAINIQIDDEKISCHLV